MMKLRFVTTQKETVIDVEWIEVQTSAGLFVIHPGHVSTIISLSVGHELFYKPVGKAIISLMVVQAVAHINPDNITIFMPIDV